MKAFQCVATDAGGKKYSGTFEAEDEAEAREMLSGEGYHVVSLVEVDRPTEGVRLPRSWGDLEKLKHRSIENQIVYSEESKGYKPEKVRTEILSYLMPLGAIIIALAGIPLTLALLGPGGKASVTSPAASPVQVVEEYFALETLEGYKEQFELLTRQRRKLFSDAETYARQRKLRKQSDAMTGLSLSVGKLTAATVERDNGREAEVTARNFREKGLVLLKVRLQKEGRNWRIASVLDPDWLQAQAARAARETKPDQQRELMQEIKRDSGLSDLVIREAVEKIETLKREEQKKKELGENYFDIFDVS